MKNEEKDNKKAKLAEALRKNLLRRKESERNDPEPEDDNSNKESK